MSDPPDDSPADFGDARGEYEAAQNGTALFDFAGRTHIELTGGDRAKFLHNFCTNDIRGLAPGQSREAFLTSVQGKVLAFVSVYATPEALWLTSVPGCAERIIAHLSRYQITEEVTFTDRTAELSALLVVGPRAPEVTAAVLPEAAALEPMHLMEKAVDGATLQVRRHDFLKGPCLVVVGPPTTIAALRERLVAAGAKPAGRSVFEALRIEAGFPLYGIDITEANLAQEASRTKTAISFTKGCYLGQEPIARIDAMGHVNQQLCGLHIAAHRAPPPATPVFSIGPDARQVGHVTSSAESPIDGNAMALAYIRRGFEKSGTALETRDSGSSAVPATVFALE